jgi:hypothetical protein
MNEMPPPSVALPPNVDADLAQGAEEAYEAQQELEGVLISTDPRQTVHELVYAELYARAVLEHPDWEADRVARNCMRAADEAASRYVAYQS